MKRRGFLKALGLAPFAGWLGAKLLPKEPVVDPLTITGRMTIFKKDLAPRTVTVAAEMSEFSAILVLDKERIFPRDTHILFSREGKYGGSLLLRTLDKMPSQSKMHLVQREFGHNVTLQPGDVGVVLGAVNVKEAREDFHRDMALAEEWYWKPMPKPGDGPYFTKGINEMLT
jgi:hypothetical protein